MEGPVTFIIEHFLTKRREVMRFFKTDTVKKITNSACKLFNVKYEEYELRYEQQKLDPNLFLMYSSLSDGTFLELCPINKQGSKEKSVVVNLVIGDEMVNSGKFRKSASLWDVSQKLLPEGKFVEDDRVCMSCLSKNIIGKDQLKKVPLSSLKCEQGPLIITLNRHYSNEKLAAHEEIKDSKVMKFNMKHDNIQQHSSKNIESRIGTVGARFSKKIVRKNAREIQNKIERSTTNFKAEAVIDKSFYLKPDKKLKDIKYLNTRKGIAYILKKSTLRGNTDESGVDLLDLRQDYIMTSDDEVQLKVILPDVTAVQGMFKKKETVKDVFGFLNHILRCENSDYFLYVMRDRKIIESTRSLKELEDNNGITLYLSLVPRIHKTWPKSRPYLKEEFLPKKH